MTKEYFDIYIESLKNRGYIYYEAKGNKPASYWKQLVYRKHYGNDFPDVICYIAFRVYVTENTEINECVYNVEPMVYVCREFGEDIRMYLGFDKRSVDEYERIAKLFLRFADNNIRYKIR